MTKDRRIEPYGVCPRCDGTGYLGMVGPRVPCDLCNDGRAVELENKIRDARRQNEEARRQAHRLERINRRREVGCTVARRALRYLRGLIRVED